MMDESLTQVQTQQSCDNHLNTERTNSSLKADKKVQIGSLEIENVKHPIYKGINLIGRHPKCHIVIPHLTVSKRHAEIEADDLETIFIMDLESSNGTMINQKRLKPNKSYQLVPKNTLSFGEVSAILNCNDDDQNFAVPESPCQNNLKRSNNSSIDTSNDQQNLPTAAPVSKSISSPENVSDTKLQEEVGETIARRNSDSVINETSTSNKSIQSDNDIFDTSPQNNSKSNSAKSSGIFDATTQHYRDPPTHNDRKSSSFKDTTIYDIPTQHCNDKEDLAATTSEQKKVETKDSLNGSKTKTFKRFCSDSNFKGFSNETSTSSCAVSNNKISETENCLEKQETKEEKEDDEIIPESDDEPLNDEEDDLFEGLPKFRIPNTLSNPASPASVVSSSSDDVPAQSLTPRSLKYKEVVRSLRTSRHFNDIDDDLDILTRIGSRLLNVQSAYDIVDPVSGDKFEDPAEETSTRNSSKEVGGTSQPAKRGAKKKAELETSSSSRMSPLAVRKGKPEVEMKDLRIKLQHVDKPSKYSQKTKIAQERMDVDTTDVVNNEVPELPSTRKTARKSKMKVVDFTKDSNVETEPMENESKNGGKSRKKRNVDEKEEIATKYQAQSKKMKTEKTLRVEDQKTSPVLNRRFIRKNNLDVHTNLSFNRSSSDLNRSALNITIQSRRSKLKVLFTGVDAAEWKKSLTKLGVSEATDIATCSVLLTDKVRRTVKFLCALSRGIPIISVKWIEDSVEKNECLDFNDYILKDTEAEKKFGFNLQESLETANTKKLFEEFTILLTPKIKAPPIADLKGIIKTAGGSTLTACPRKWPKNVVIVTTENDIETAKKFAAKAPKDVTIHSTELILTGILRQEIDLQSFKMDYS